MTELEEAREAIAKITECKSDYCQRSKDCWRKVCSECKADQILKLPNIAVLAKDQKPPKSPVYLGEDSVSIEAGFREGQKSMLKANFKRVIEER